MSNANTKTGGWEVRTVTACKRNGGLTVEGANHHDQGRDFCWHIDHHSILNAEYDWSGAVWTDEAREVYARLLMRCAADHAARTAR